MKKYIFISAVALLALAACTKVTTGDEFDMQREISFEVAKYVQTKANVKYDTAETFGTYAWFNNGTAVSEWMVNETVGFVGGVWKTTAHAYYWPKTGSADFISYSPFAGTVNVRPAAAAAATEEAEAQEPAPAPAPEPIITRVKDNDYTFEYGKYLVNGSKYDLMYADLATANANVDEVQDGVDSGYKGVPTLFHHALSRVGIQIGVNFLEDPDKTTKWEVTLQEAKLKNVKHTGSLKLTMADKAWVKPAGEIWTPDAASAAETIVMYELPKEEEPAADTKVPGLPLTTEFYDLLAEQFMLPQSLEGEGETVPTLSLKIHIRTTLSNGLVINETYTKDFPLQNLQLKSWKMNQRIIYKISFKPTANIDDPDTPVDATITFDPAQVDWETIEDNAIIQI